MKPALQSKQQVPEFQGYRVPALRFRSGFWAQQKTMHHSRTKRLKPNSHWETMPRRSMSRSQKNSNSLIFSMACDVQREQLTEPLMGIGATGWKGLSSWNCTSYIIDHIFSNQLGLSPQCCKPEHLVLRLFSIIPEEVHRRGTTCMGYTRYSWMRQVTEPKKSGGFYPLVMSK